MHDGMHEGYGNGWNDQDEGDYYYDEPLYQDGQSIAIGETSIQGNYFCFWNGTVWEPVELPNGEKLEIQNEEEAEIVSMLNGEDPYKAVIAAMKYDTREYSREDLVSSLAQSEFENAEYQMLLNEWFAVGLTPYQMECIISLLEEQNEVVKQYAELGGPAEIIEALQLAEQQVHRYERIGTPEQIDRILEMTEKHARDLGNFKQLVRDMEGQEKTWGTLQAKGWKMVALDPTTYNRLNAMKTVETIIDGDQEFKYTNLDKGIGD